MTSAATAGGRRADLSRPVGYQHTYPPHTGIHCPVT